MNTPLLKNYRRDITVLTAALAVVLNFTQCTPKQTATVSSVPNTTPHEDPNKGLKDYFKNYSKIGVAVSINSIRQDSALII